MVLIEGGVGDRWASRLMVPDELLLMVMMVFLVKDSDLFSTARAEPDEESARPLAVEAAACGSLTLAVRLSELDELDV